MGPRKQREKQEDLSDPSHGVATAPGHPLKQKLNELLKGFDELVGRENSARSSMLA